MYGKLPESLSAITGKMTQLWGGLVCVYEGAVKYFRRSSLWCNNYFKMIFGETDGIRKKTLKHYNWEEVLKIFLFFHEICNKNYNI